MAEYLDTSNLDNLGLIEIIYSEYSKNVKPDSLRETNNLINSIKYYRNHTYEEVVEDIETKAKLEKIDIEFELENAQKDMLAFGLMTKEQAEKYVSLYFQMCLTANSYEARKKAIYETAKEQGAKPPKCLREKRVIYKEASRIAKIEEQTEEDISLKNRVVNKIKQIDSKIYNNLRLTLTTIGLGVLISTVTGMCIINNTGNETAGITAVLLGSPIIIGGIATAYKTPDIKDYLKDKKTIEEAKNLGLLDHLVNWNKASKEFSDYDKSIREEYGALEIDGGIKL